MGITELRRGQTARSLPCGQPEGLDGSRRTLSTAASRPSLKDLHGGFRQLTGDSVGIAYATSADLWTSPITFGSESASQLLHEGADSGAGTRQWLRRPIEAEGMPGSQKPCIHSCEEPVRYSGNMNARSPETSPPTVTAKYCRPSSR